MFVPRRVVGTPTGPAWQRVRRSKAPVYLIRNASEKPVTAAQIAECADVRQRKGEAELVFVPDRTQVEAAVFDADAATVPIVGGLHRGVYQVNLMNDGTVLGNARMVIVR